MGTLRKQRPQNGDHRQESTAKDLQQGGISIFQRLALLLHRAATSPTGYGKSRSEADQSPGSSRAFCLVQQRSSSTAGLPSRVLRAEEIVPQIVGKDVLCVAKQRSSAAPTVSRQTQHCGADEQPASVHVHAHVAGTSAGGEENFLCHEQSRPENAQHAACCVAANLAWTHEGAEAHETGRLDGSQQDGP